MKFLFIFHKENWVSSWMNYKVDLTFNKTLYHMFWNTDRVKNQSCWYGFYDKLISVGAIQL